VIPSPNRQVTQVSRKRWERVLTATIIVAVLVTVVWVAAANWDAYRTLVQSLNPVHLLGALAAGLIGQFLNVVIAHISLRGEGVPLSLGSTYRLITVGGLAKYIPGSVWQIGSQAGLGRTAGLNFRHSMLAWIEPTVFNITVGSGFALLAATQVEYGIPDLFLIPVGLFALIASMNPFRYAVYRLVRLTPRSNPVPLIRTGWPQQFLLTVAIIALTGTGGMLVVSAFELESSIGFIGSVVAFVGAWVVGFLAFPIPGGIGVREGALVLALAPWIPAHEAVLIAAASRLVAITGELASGLAGMSVGLRTKPISTRDPNIES
jgi:hypothetical protein